ILSATDASVGAIRRFAFIDCKAAVSTFTRRAQCAVTYRDCPANRPNLALSTIHRVSRSRRLAASARGYLNNLVGTKRPSITGVIADACAVYWPSIILLLFVALSFVGGCRSYTSVQHDRTIQIIALLVAFMAAIISTFLLEEPLRRNRS